MKFPLYFCRLALWSLVGASSASASTSITFTRDDVAQMATLWETDTIAISSLADSQYPVYTATWQYIFPHTNISGDGDNHTDMAVDAAGTGKAGNNTGASPIVCEIVNTNSSQVSHLISLNGRQAIFRGIFRFYTEHAGERHFELHPSVELDLWNGSAFVKDTDYHANITTVADATNHTTATMAAVIDGSQKITATVRADNLNVDFVFPSPSVNYVQYDGVALSAVVSDAVSSYFLFRPNSVPSVTLKCRLTVGTAAAAGATALNANQTVTVNALTRTDMSAISAQLSTMNPGDTATFGRPIELITLGLVNIGPGPTPTPNPTPTPSATPTPSPTATPIPTPTPSPTPSPTTTSLANAASISFAGSASGIGKAALYPSSIDVSGVAGTITKITAQLNGFSADKAQDADILLVGPAGQTVMLISDAGGSHAVTNLNLTFDDIGAAPSRNGRLISGTFAPSNYTPAGDTDAFPSPAPAGSPGSTLSVFNSSNPNGTWSLYVIAESTSGTGSLSGGWSITITSKPAALLVNTTAAGAISSSTATLHGAVNPLGLPGTWAFNFGPSTAYTDTQPDQDAGSGTSTFPVSLLLAGLRPGMTYHYRLTGRNSVGAALGNDISFTTAPFVDSDRDGMPDDYEMANGFDPQNAADGAIDSDGDGLSNAQEYGAGTNPRDQSSTLRVSDIRRTGDDILITFPTVLGKRYRLQQCSDLSIQNWGTLEDNIPGTGAPVTSFDFAVRDVVAIRYYRVLVLP